jgi:SAM-dependent methyltransferase
MRRREAMALDKFRPALAACASGAVPANVAVLRLVIDAASPDEVADAIEAASGMAEDPEARERLVTARRLLAGNPQAFRLIKTVLGDVEHGGTASGVSEGLGHWAAAFDRMARASPEGAVALYALGNADLLQQATDEVVRYLGMEGLTGPRVRVLEIGCGIGRFVRALSPAAASVTGIDIAPVMIAEARRRCAGLGNVRLEVSSGRDLAAFEDAAVDLILAADVVPYLVQTGYALVDDHVREARRVLALGGSFVILNFSYRGDPGRDGADVRRLAAAHRLAVAASGERPFSLWDASVFRLTKIA